MSLSVNHTIYPSVQREREGGRMDGWMGGWGVTCEKERERVREGRRVCVCACERNVVRV